METSKPTALLSSVLLLVLVLANTANAVLEEPLTFEGSTPHTSGSSLIEQSSVNLDVEGISRDERMIWGNLGPNEVRSIPLGGSMQSVLATTADRRWLIYGVDYDPLTDSVYYAVSGINDLLRVDANGGVSEKLLDLGGRPHSLEIDVQNRLVYWTEFSTSSAIKAASLDTLEPTALVEVLDRPEGLALDLSNDHMYWSEVFTGVIKRANLDGTDVSVVVSSGVDRPTQIAIDAEHSKIYWVDYGTDGDDRNSSIRRSNMDGTDVEELLSGIRFARDIDLDLVRNQMYWSGDGAIWKATLDGQNREVFVDNVDAFRFSLYTVPEPSSVTVIALCLVAGACYWSQMRLRHVGDNRMRGYRRRECAACAMR